jgi:uracil-DNA glycosylase
VTDLSTLADTARACVACGLSAGRTTVVFGVGDPHARLMFVGEGPGHDEDLAGEPFVGRSGKLLDRLIAEELEMARADVYIANVVKCRPPNNRNPLPDEVATCKPYLDGQIAAIAPTVIVGLGNFAVQTLLETTTGVSRLRGASYPFRGGSLIPTYHPSYVLRRGSGAELAQMRADFIRAKQLLREAA